MCTGAVKEILSGYIEPSPLCQSESDNICKWCEFAEFCGLEKSKFARGRKCVLIVDAESFKEDKEDGDE